MAKRTPTLHLPAGSAVSNGDPVLVTPASAGWRYTGLRVMELAPGEDRSFPTSEFEMLVLPLAGSCTVHAGGKKIEVKGRESVFSRVSDFVYLPPGALVRVTTVEGGRFALPMARAEQVFSVAYVPADEVVVETRGAGAATRQLNNFFAPGRGSAHRLVAVEVLTPSGNTSSYPPHKHDVEVSGREAELEEIYYFEFDRPNGFGMHRTYASDGSFDVTASVGHGDVFLIPSGYHGPCSAMPGYDMYYLNVLAGPGIKRSLAFSDDPKHAWIRPSWTTQTIDPRVPMTSATGRMA